MIKYCSTIFPIILFLLTLSSCKTMGDTIALPSATTRSVAVQLAAGHYNQLFQNLYFQNSIDRAHYKFPSLEASEFRVVKDDDYFWYIQYEPLVGPTIKLQVGKHNGLVQVNSVELSLE